MAEALAEFADEEELAEVVAAMASDEAWTAASNAHLRSAEVDTANWQGAGSVGSHVHRRSQSRRMARRRLRRNLKIVLFGGLVAVVSALLVWIATRPHGQLQPAATTSTTAPPPVTREPIAAELALLPGLNGPWWFEETPWLTPFLRRTMAEKVLASPVRQADLAAVLGDHPHRYLDANTAEVQRWLWEAASRCRGALSASQLRLVDQLKTFADGKYDDDAKAAEALRDALRQFINGHGDDALSATDLHTVALLRHRIAVLGNDKARARDAKQSYDAALDAYAAQKETPASTRLLCLVDSALLCAGPLGDVKEARQRMDDALAAKDLPVLFRVSTLVARGVLAAVSATNPGEYEDYRFLYAKKVFAGADGVNAVHPLAAYVAERYAWSLMEQWKVEEANKQFQAAYHIRWTNQEEKNPHAAIYVFHDRVGMALASRYHGNLDAARRIDQSVVDEVQLALDEAKRQGADGGAT